MLAGMPRDPRHPSKSAAKAARKARRARVINVVGTALMVILGAAVLYAALFLHVRPPRRGHRAATERDAAATAPCPTRAGEAWEYDPETRCYWDPTIGGGAWERGAPPPPDERARRLGGS